MGKPIILCVDDEKIILDSLESELSKSVGEDYIIELAESGEEALEIVEEIIEDGNQLALVISDYIMPGMKGDEVLIKIHEILPDTLKIMLTGQADANAVGNVINQAKLYQYISKPWEREDLVLTINNALSQYQNHREMMLAIEGKKDAQKKIIDTRKKMFEAHNQKIKEHQMSIEDLNKEIQRVSADRNSLMDKYSQMYDENKQLKLRAVAYKKKLDEIDALMNFQTVVKKEVQRASDFNQPLSLVTFGIDSYEMVSKKIDNKKEELQLITLIKQYMENITKSYNTFQKTDTTGKFQILLVNATTPKAREIVADINQQLSVKIGRYKETMITFSFGIATYINTSGDSVNIDEVSKSLLDKSETAYIQAKADGRSSVSEIK
jgi:CheY-like chemotaxis protein